MNAILKQRIDNLNKELAFMNQSDSIKRVKNEVKQLLLEYKITTVRTYLTSYRKFINSNNAKVIKALSISKGRQSEIERSYSKKVAKANKRGKKINNVERMIDRAIELLESEKLGEIVCGLCLLTGRRMTEILKTAKFTNARSSPLKMYFTGQLKTKDLSKKYEIYAIRKTRDLCKKALKRVRNKAVVKSLTNRQALRRYESVVNGACKMQFSEFVGKRDIDRCTAHDLRNVYALYCLEHYKKNKWQTANSFLSEILGHESDDVNTANSYQKFYLE